MLANFRSLVDSGLQYVSPLSGASAQETTLVTEENKISEKAEESSETKASSKVLPTTYDIKTTLDTAKNWGSSLYNYAKQSAEEVTHKALEFDYKAVLEQTPILGEFTQVQEEFKREQLEKNAALTNGNFDPGSECREPVSITGSKSPSTVLPPWHPSVSGVSDPLAVAKFRTQVFGLSLEARNFLRNPPTASLTSPVTTDAGNSGNSSSNESQSPLPVGSAGVPGPCVFEWSEAKMARYLPTALLLLEADENLRQMRFRLVPGRLSEQVFWRNYFYRISVIRQSVQLTAMASAPIDDGLRSDDDSVVHVERADLITDEELEAELSRELASLNSEGETRDIAEDNAKAKAKTDADGVAKTKGQVSKAVADAGEDAVDDDLELEILAELEKQ